MGTKKNPGQYDCYAKAEDDEPMFVLLARDPLAPHLVRIWAHLAAEEGGPNAARKVDEAHAVANAMETWRAWPDWPDPKPERGPGLPAEFAELVDLDDEVDDDDEDLDDNPDLDDPEPF